MPSVLITGASRGLGLEFARQYAAEGWQVFACCRDPANVGSLRDLARQAGERVTVRQLDVRARPEIEALAETFGGVVIDVLLNNAGIYGPRPSEFGRSDDDGWARVLDTNVIGPMRMAEAFADNVAASARKLICTISSRMGSIGANTAGGAYVYRSSKAALNAVVKSLSIDLAPRGITCVSFHPGWVRTDMGGPSDDISAKESVAGMRRVIEGLGPADSGRFINYDGSAIVW